MKNWCGFSCTSRFIFRLTCRDSLLKEQIVVLFVIVLCLQMFLFHILHKKVGFQSDMQRFIC